VRFAPRLTFTIPLPHGAALLLGERPLVMGILNLTPDSFAERTPLDPGRVVAVAQAMEAAGADLLDIGGESTRPGATPVSVEEELARVLPALRALAGEIRVPISVDTQKAPVAAAAVAEGAVLVNDVSGLQADAAMAGVVARSGAALVLMHSRGGSGDMYARAHYDDPIADVAQELGARVSEATAAGIAADRLILDPGIGFAKRPGHSYGVLARLPELAALLGRPLLVGPSRKSFMNEALGGVAPADRDWGTAAAVTSAILSGAHIVRVHAVAEMVQVVRVAEAIRQHASYELD
jgi:dihydropteroate synthase